MLLYPLERVRVELQSKANDDRDDDNISSETITQCLLRLYQEQTLYKGASHMVTTLTISNAIFFYALQIIRRRLSSLQSLNTNQRYQHHNRRYNSYILNLLHHTLFKSKMGRSLVASTIAGCINVLLTNPLWVASLRIMESRIPTVEVEGNDDDTTQQQANQKPTLWNVMQRIVQSEGISSLWNGTSTSLLLVSNPIIQHFMYEQLRTLILRRQQRARQRSERKVSLSPLEAFLFGALAKAVATVATYPLQLAQVLLRLQRKKLQSDQQGSNSKDIHDTTVYNGTLDCLGKQFSSRGISGLFQGMNAKLLQTVLTSAFTFLTYEQTLSQVGRLYEMLK